MTYELHSKKKKKTVIYLISGIIITIVIVGTIIYFAWPKSKSEKSQEPNQEEQINLNKEIQKLKTELKAAKSKLDKLENNTKKSELENKLSDIENQIKNFSNPDKNAIKKLEKEIKEIKQKIESGDKPDKPDDDNDSPPNPDPQPDNKGWKYVATKINDNTYKYKITLKSLEIDFNNFIGRLRTKDEIFFQVFQGALKDANSKFPAYFWECPPVSEKTLDKTFEFVVTKSESLANITQDWKDFKEYLAECVLLKKPATSFPNNRTPSDAILVIPKLEESASGEKHDYKNLSQFTKNAPEEQQQALWKEVAEKLMEELKKGDTPRWLSTSGLGIHYLHVRIDERPKYYSYAEYKKWE